jgi:hypothetical protein
MALAISAKADFICQPCRKPPTLWRGGASCRFEYLHFFEGLPRSSILQQTDRHEDMVTKIARYPARIKKQSTEPPTPGPFCPDKRNLDFVILASYRS